MPKKQALFIFNMLALFISLTSVAFSQDYIFKDVSEQAGIHAIHRAVWDPEGTKEGYLAIGQAWADYDNDGWLELYVTGNLADNVLYKNNGDGTFSVSPLSEQVSLPDVTSGGAVWADYDNDGWKDLYVLNFGKNTLFHNDAGQGFSDVTDVAGVGDTGKGESATWGDYDSDGFLDLYVVNWSCLPECGEEKLNLYQDRLYHNNGDGTFNDVTHLLTDKTQGAGFAASFFDYDNDGDPDIYVVNDKMSNPIGNVLWRNDGPGCAAWCWTEASEEAGLNTQMHAMGLAVGDYNNDSQQDVYASNMMGPMMLGKNLGNGKFEDASEAAGVMVLDSNREAVGWGTALFDYDNDGWLDLYLATTAMAGGPPGLYGGSAPDMEDFHHPYADLLYHNNGDGTFSPVENGLTDNEKATMGFAYADYDNDGLMDFVQGNWNEGYALYHNETSQEQNWLTVQLSGGGSINHDAVGARVYLTDTSGLTQMREVIVGSSLGAGHDPRLHFGLGQATIENVLVVWPNGLKQTFNDVAHNQMWQLRYVNGSDDGSVATDWFKLSLELVQQTPGYSPPVASRAFAYLGVTLYEAVEPGFMGYQSLAGQLNGLEPLPQPEVGKTYHWPTVANSALASITQKMFASATPENLAKVRALESKFSNRFKVFLEPEVFEASVSQGQAVAEAIYAWSMTDGGHEGYAHNVREDYLVSIGPGLWESTPPAFGKPLQPTWGNNRSFILAGSECPVTPPLAYSEDPASAFYNQAQEVYQTVSHLSDEGREIALFWADGPAETATPPGHWISIVTRVLSEGGYGLEHSSVTYAKLSITLADAFIVCWKEKYQYNLLRPISYIQKVIDVNWNTPDITDPVVTPPFPEYPSGHSVQSSAAATVLTDLFGEVAFTDHTHDKRGFAPRSFTSFWDAAEEAAVSRLYGGIHFRAAIEQGLVQGQCIGQKALLLQFKSR